MTVPFLERTRSRAAFDEIALHVAGGESSYARLRAGQELVIDQARGATIRDLDGNSYIDYCMGYGVNLFGHAPAFVWEAVEETVARLGWHLAFPHRLVGETAELVAELVPGIEQLRFANSGTEATQAAVRLARAATGRELVIEFEGHYHGWADHLAAGSGPASVASPARPDSAGIPAGVMQSLWTVPWNDSDALAEAITAAGDRLAAVICEVVPGSGGVLEPRPGFLDQLVSLTRAAGALVIFDEVMTGFRLAPGGAQERYGVTPDITTLGKVIGGGMAVAAFGGSRELMRWEAENRVVHGGTYTGSPLGLAASGCRAPPDRGRAWAVHDARAALGASSPTGSRPRSTTPVSKATCAGSARCCSRSWRRARPRSPATSTRPPRCSHPIDISPSATGSKRAASMPTATPLDAGSSPSHTAQTRSRPRSAPSAAPPSPLTASARDVA